MDLFVFPSHTDTFGNVVLEALASGVPAVVTPDGGPATIVREGGTGRIGRGCGICDSRSAEIFAIPQQHAAMREAARAYALTASWDSVFEACTRRTKRCCRPACPGRVRASFEELRLKVEHELRFSRSCPHLPAVPRTHLAAMVTPSCESFADCHASPATPHAKME